MSLVDDQTDMSAQQAGRDGEMKPEDAATSVPTEGTSAAPEAVAPPAIVVEQLEVLANAPVAHLLDATHETQNGGTEATQKSEAHPMLTEKQGSMTEANMASRPAETGADPEHEDGGRVKEQAAKKAQATEKAQEAGVEESKSKFFHAQIT